MDEQDLRIENSVIFGSAGQLFLASERHATLDFVFGRREVAAASYRNFRDNLARRREFAEKMGGRYLHLIAPDKHVVCRGDFPVKKFSVLGDLYRQHSTDDFVFPVEALQAAEGGGYLQTDTHWSVPGQVAVARLIAERFGLEAGAVASAVAALQPGIRSRPQPVAGDLGVKLAPPQTEIQKVFDVPWKLHSFSNEMRSGNDGIIRVTFSECPAAQGRLLVFGDSFLAQSQNILSAFFKEIVFCRTRFFHEEMVVSVRPDFVLTQNVERYLISVGSDQEAPPMLLMAQITGRQVNYHEKNVAALGAILAPRSRAYQKFIAELYGTGRA